LVSRRSKTSKIFAWVIVFILVIGLAGFGIQDVLRSSGTNEVATFGNQKISSDDYVRMIQQEIRSLSQRFGTQLSFSQAQNLGVSQIALQKLISSAILDQTVLDLGFSQSDTILKEAIQNNIAFGDIAGRFDPIKYKDILLNINLEPSEYEEILRKELARNVFLNLTSTKIIMDDKANKLIVDYLLEERVSDMIILKKDDLDNNDLTISSLEAKEFYVNSEDLFRQPETKKISYIYLSSKAIAEIQEISDKEIENTYLAQKDSINSPEKRDVDQIFFTDRESAQTTLASASNKLLSFEKVLQERGLTKTDVSLGEIIKSDLPLSAQGAVFLPPGPSVIGPFETELGLAVYRVNKVIPEVTKTLTDVYETIKSGIALEKASSELNELLAVINDEIAAGSSLEDIAATTKMIFGNLEFFVGAELPDFANTVSFRAMVQSGKSYASDVKFNDDGGIFSVRIDETIEPFVKAFINVETLAKEKALEQKIISMLELKALEIATEQKQSGRNLLDLVGNLGYESLKDKQLSRFAKLDNFPENFAVEVFSLKPNETKVVLGAAKAYIIQLKDILFKELEDEESALLKEQISSQYVTSLEQDIVSSLIDGLETNHDLYISQRAVDIAIERFN
jgi:peptidyl-prolyl cis-trans isomerase D